MGLRSEDRRVAAFAPDMGRNITSNRDFTMAQAGDRHSPRPDSGDPARFGPCAIVREAPPSGDAHLLSLFVGAEGTPMVDRRRSPRVQAVERRAWLGWWSTPAQFTTHAARLD